VQHQPGDEQRRDRVSALKAGGEITPAAIAVPMNA
jgi:hypothetical protein